MPGLCYSGFDNLPAVIDRIPNSSSPLNTLYIQIKVDYSHWTATSTILDDLATFDVYMMSASQRFDFANIYFPAVSPFPLHRNVHLRGVVTVGVRKVIDASWRDFLGFQPVCVDW